MKNRIIFGGRGSGKVVRIYKELIEQSKQDTVQELNVLKSTYECLQEKQVSPVEILKTHGKIQGINEALEIVQRQKLPI